MCWREKWREKRQRDQEPAPPPTATTYKCNICERTFKASIGQIRTHATQAPASLHIIVDTDGLLMNDDDVLDGKNQ